MKRSQRSNRVSWAPDVNLCQVKLFVSEDCPSQVGLGTQDHLQTKTSWILHSNSMDSNGHLPPGFDSDHYVKRLKEELPHIPQIRWKCPPKYTLSYNWHVAAGEESEEAEAQKLREMRVLEAVYPRLSAIPPSPSKSLDTEEYHYDDRHTPIVPLTPIEDECMTDLPSDLEAPMNASLSSQPPALPQYLLASGTPNTTQSSCPALKPLASENPGLSMLPGLEADVIAAASFATAALSVILKSKEQGSMIDTDLLIKILSNPKMVEKLINAYGAPANAGSAPKSGSNLPMSCPEPDMVLSSRPASINLEPVLTSKTMPLQIDAAVSVSVPKPAVNPSAPLCIPEPNMALSSRPANENLYPLPNRPPPTSNMAPPQSDPVPISSFSAMKALPPPPPPPRPAPVKDLNYYKSLVKQHGGESRDSMDRNLSNNGNRHSRTRDTELVHQIKPKELNPKAQKPCIYFKGPKGCRRGSSCPYRHDGSCHELEVDSMLEAPRTKRMKLGREITGSR